MYISPSSRLALACAIDPYDEHAMMGKPALFALQSNIVQASLKIKEEAQSDMKSYHSDVDTKSLSQALVDGLVARKSIGDVLLLADRLSLGMSWRKL